MIISSNTPGQYALQSDFPWGKALILVNSPNENVAMESAIRLQKLWTNATWKTHAAKDFFTASFNKIRNSLAEQLGKEKARNIEFAILCERDKEIFLVSTGNYLFYTRIKNRFSIHQASLFEKNKVADIYCVSFPENNFNAIFVTTKSALPILEKYNPDEIWQNAPQGEFIAAIERIATAEQNTTIFALHTRLDDRPNTITPNKPTTSLSKAKRSYLFNYAAAAAILITFIHYNYRWMPLLPNTTSSELAPTESDTLATPPFVMDFRNATEIETFRGFDWSKRICRTPPSDTIKDQLGRFRGKLTEKNAIDNEKEIGTTILNEYRRSTGVSFNLNTKESEYITKLTKRIATQLKLEKEDYDIHVSESKSENAFALPGGTIIIERGLLKKHINNEAQLAFVIAHELAHVALSHNNELLKISKVKEFNFDFLDVLLTNSFRTAFGLSQEKEADQTAITTLVSLGYSPFQAIATLKSIHSSYSQEETNNDELNKTISAIFETLQQVQSSHPDIASRICEFENTIIDKKDILTKNNFYIGTSNFLSFQPASEVIY